MKKILYKIVMVWLLKKAGAFLLKKFSKGK